MIGYTKRSSTSGRVGYEESITSWHRIFDGYELIIRDYENLWGGKRTAEMHMLPSSEAVPKSCYRLQTPSVSVFATGAKTEEIEAFMARIFEAIKDERLNRL